MPRPFLSVVIPCYNEQKNIELGVLAEVNSYLTQQSYEFEVIISDDGSSDSSRELIEAFIADKPFFSLMKNQHAGKASAVKSGVLESEGRFVLVTDFDQSTPLSECEKLLPCLQEGYDIAIGSRGTERADAPWYRLMMARGFLLIRRSLLLRDILDTQCGFKCFTSDAAHDLFKLLDFNTRNVTGWRVTAFDVETLFVARLRGYKIKEVQVQWQHKTTEGKQTNFAKEAWNMLHEVTKVRKKYFAGVYERLMHEKNSSHSAHS